MICLLKTILRAISRCPPGESEMDAGPAQWAKKLFRGCAAAWFRIWSGELSVHHSIPICRDATREFCEARCPWFPWVASPIPWAKSAFMLSSGCPCGYQSNGDSKSQSFSSWSLLSCIILNCTFHGGLWFSSHHHVQRLFPQHCFWAVSQWNLWAMAAMARQVSVARFGCPQQPMTRQPSQECAARHCGARRGVILYV